MQQNSNALLDLPLTLYKASHQTSHSITDCSGSTLYLHVQHVYFIASAHCSPGVHIFITPPNSLSQYGPSNCKGGEWVVVLSTYTVITTVRTNLHYLKTKVHTLTHSDPSPTFSGSCDVYLPHSLAIIQLLCRVNTVVNKSL